MEKNSIIKEMEQKEAIQKSKLEVIEMLRQANTKGEISPKDFLNNFITIKKTSNIGEVIYCIQVPDPKYKDLCSVVALAVVDGERYSQVGKLTFAVKDLEKKEIWLDKIYVAPNFKRKGIGSTLLSIFEKTCSSELGNNVKVSGLVLADDDDEMAIKGVCHFYENNGYKIIHQNNGFTTTIEKTLKKKFSLFKSNNSSMIELKEKM